jgi:regulator of sirC expression with transglutaminase-like and TPR domain
VRTPFADSPEFQRLLADDGPVHLARIALEIARDAYPDLEIEPYLGRIRVLADRVRLRCPRGSKVRDILGQINWVLFVEEEMRGNGEDYYDPRNSYLNEVLDRRLGIPISLSVLYQAVAEPLGLSMAGVNLPAHFMLRVDDGEQTWFVDPYDSGNAMSRAACQRKLSDILQQPVDLTDAMAAACPVAVVVTRMLRNVKAIYLNANDIPSALPVQRRLAALNPRDSQEVQDMGVLCLNADRPGEAIDPLQAYLATAPDSAKAQEIRALLEVARRRVAQSN